jgi:peroxiredoxin
MKKFILLTLFFTVFAFGGDTKPPKIGEKVPSFTLKNYDGKDFSLDTVMKHNKYTVLMFISTECPVSNAYNERMVKLYSQYNAKGVAFLGINANKAEPPEDIEAHAKEKGFKFPVLKDVKNKIADAYGAMVTPEVYVISSDGRLLYHGRIDDSRNPEKVTSNDLANTLDLLLAGEGIAVSETKAFGCTIKRVSED